MSYISFKVRNTNSDQMIVVNDNLDTSKNPIFNEFLNKDETSDLIYCAKNSDGEGRISINGTNKDVTRIGETIDW